MMHQRLFANVIAALFVSLSCVGCAPRFVFHLAPGIVGGSHVPAPWIPAELFAPDPKQVVGGRVKASIGFHSGAVSLTQALFEQRGIRLAHYREPEDSAQFVRETFDLAGGFYGWRGQSISECSDGPDCIVIAGDWTCRELGTRPLIVVLVDDDDSDGGWALLVEVAEPLEEGFSKEGESAEGVIAKGADSLKLRGLASRSCSSGVEIVQPVYQLHDLTPRTPSHAAITD